MRKTAIPWRKRDYSKWLLIFGWGISNGKSEIYVNNAIDSDEISIFKDHHDVILKHCAHAHIKQPFEHYNKLDYCIALTAIKLKTNFEKTNANKTSGEPAFFVNSDLIKIHLIIIKLSAWSKFISVCYNFL